MMQDGSSWRCMHTLASSCNSSCSTLSALMVALLSSMKQPQTATATATATAAAAAVHQCRAAVTAGRPGCCVRPWLRSGTGCCHAAGAWTRTGLQPGCYVQH